MMSNRNYLGITALYSLMGVTAGTLGSLMVLVQRASGASLSQIGFMVSLFSLGSLIGIALFNSWSSTLAAGKVVPAGFGTLIAGYFIIVNTSNAYISLMSSLILGVGFGVLDLGLAQIVTRSKNNSPVRTNISNAIFGLGGIAGSAFVALFGIQAFKNFTYLILAIGILASYLLSDNSWKSQKASKRIFDFAPRKVVLPSLAATGIYVALELAAASWLPSLVESRNQNGEEGAAATALFYALFTAGRFIGAYLSRKLTAETLIQLSLLLTLPPIAMAIVIDDPSIFLIAFTGLSLGPIFANTMTFLVSATPNNHGASALALYASMTGSLVLFPVIGVVVDSSNVGSFPIILLILLLASTIFYRIAFTAKRAGAVDQ